MTFGHHHHHHHGHHTEVVETVYVQQPAPVYQQTVYPPQPYGQPGYPPQGYAQPGYPQPYATETVVTTIQQQPGGLVNNHGKRAFQAHNGTFLTAEDGGLFNEPYLSHKAHFHLEWHHDDIYTIRCHHSKWLAVDYNGYIYTTHSHGEHNHTKFRVENINGRVAIKAHHGPYIGVKHGSVHLSNHLGEHELFNIMVV
ncbi:hypothetical protein PROFUN_04790 [Planoprotostelium fungivorum]|uniref:Fascin-like domain-containing protein n=1 Tax=Planoprotostelium fungivorum TaxID=1890364 RepID=A0A2P6NSW9_9EUKA|nr:hypothetical protein PROFUN_04790 [Planoprotostelium fungivorum]